MPAGTHRFPAIWSLAIHGGAGSARARTPHEHRAAAGAERHAHEHEALTCALEAGRSILADGGTSLDAVEAAVRVLEDSPLFNAGRGAVFNAAGEHELDASIMEGSALRAGAVAAVSSVKNPVTLARAVMDQTAEVLLDGDGALALARRLGIALAEAEYFRTERRWEALQAARALAAAGDRERPPADFSTVGAVALDRNGHLAAATSTGGLTNKPVGRIGDSAVIGAGTFASDASCAVSATGSGEHLIRATVARDIAALIEYAGTDTSSAVDRAIGRLAAIGGLGGVAVVDRAGEAVFRFNTEVMYRGAVSSMVEAWTAV